MPNARNWERETQPYELCGLVPLWGEVLSAGYAVQQQFGQKQTSARETDFAGQAPYQDADHASDKEQ